MRRRQHDHSHLSLLQYLAQGFGLDFAKRGFTIFDDQLRRRSPNTCGDLVVEIDHDGVVAAAISRATFVLPQPMKPVMTIRFIRVGSHPAV